MTAEEPATPTLPVTPAEPTTAEASALKRPSRFRFRPSRDRIGSRCPSAGRAPARFHADGMTRPGTRSLSLAFDDVEQINGREDGHA
jgi:hypothetical protein